MKSMKSLSSVLLAFALVAGSALAADDKKAEGKTYPLKTCVVSGEKLGEMGDPYVFKHEGREVKLCCEGCLKDFKKDPAKFLKKLDKAEKSAKK